MRGVSVMTGSFPPSNLGRLGEEYVYAWLRLQSWVEPQSVHWLNQHEELYEDHDIQGSLTSGRRCCHVEVKTTWGHFGNVAVSRRQLVRLQDSNDDNILLLVGHFRNLFAEVASPPDVRILSNVIGLRSTNGIGIANKFSRGSLPNYIACLPRGLLGMLSACFAHPLAAILQSLCGRSL